MKSVHGIALSIAFGLGACGDGITVNPPTEPAPPVVAVDPVDSVAPADPGRVSMVPSRGPPSFVGRWAADVAWCAAPQGERRPIEITATRFEGYENSCAISAVEEVADGYVASLSCLSEGVGSGERVKLAVAGDTLRMTWLDRGEPVPVTLRQCTTLADTDPRPPGL